MKDHLGDAKVTETALPLSLEVPTDCVWVKIRDEPLRCVTLQTKI